MFEAVPEERMGTLRLPGLRREDIMTSGPSCLRDLVGQRV